MQAGALLQTGPRCYNERVLSPTAPALGKEVVMGMLLLTSVAWLALGLLNVRLFLVRSTRFRSAVLARPPARLKDFETHVRFLLAGESNLFFCFVWLLWPLHLPHNLWRSRQEKQRIEAMTQQSTTPRATRLNEQEPCR